jgi:hypothetical protein
VAGVELEIPVGWAKFVILSADLMKPVKLSVDKSVEKGGMLIARLQTGDNSARPVWLKGLTPEGVDTPWIDKVLVIEGGEASFQIPVALNEEPGIWKLQAVDWFTGAVSEEVFKVE